MATNGQQGSTEMRVDCLEHLDAHGAETIEAQGRDLLQRKKKTKKKKKKGARRVPVRRR